MVEVSHFPVYRDSANGVAELMPRTDRLWIPPHFEKYKQAIVGWLDWCYNLTTFANVSILGTSCIDQSITPVCIIYSLLHSTRRKTPWIVFQSEPGMNWGMICFGGNLCHTRGCWRIADVADEMAFASNGKDGRGFCIVDTNCPRWSPLNDCTRPLGHIVIARRGQRFSDNLFGRLVDQVPRLKLMMPPWPPEDILDFQAIWFPS